MHLYNPYIPDVKLLSSSLHPLAKFARGFRQRMKLSNTNACLSSNSGLLNVCMVCVFLMAEIEAVNTDQDSVHICVQYTTYTHTRMHAHSPLTWPEIAARIKIFRDWLVFTGL